MRKRLDAVQETPKRIGLPPIARDRIAARVQELDQYLAGVRDSLSVPRDWIIQRDQRGVPVAFVPGQQASSAPEA